MDNTNYNRKNTDGELKSKFKSNVEFTFCKMKDFYYDQTKYLSTQPKIDFIDGELLNCDSFITNPYMREMIADNTELERFAGSILLETNQLYTDFLENELDELEQIQLNKKQQKQIQSVKTQPKLKQFSVLEWATIFYYADESKLTSNDKTIKARMGKFIDKHQIQTTINSFKNKYYEVKKRINNKNDYPLSKLELIMPFLKENYKRTVTLAENDKVYLNTENPDN